MPPVDWRAPWLAPLRDLRRYFERDDWREALSAAGHERCVVTASGLPIVFVAAGDAGGASYEAHIAASGRVPSRDNAHDRFNALMWLAWPRTKAALNARQAAELARDGVIPRRGPVRDAATLIDESGLLLLADDEAETALRRLDWGHLFGAQRARWGRDWLPFVFGHALLDKLLAPYKALTAAVVCLDASAGDADAVAARWVLSSPLAPPLLAHLPVLGVPGWWPANEQPAFYADAAVFRVRAVALPEAGGGGPRPTLAADSTEAEQ